MSKPSQQDVVVIVRLPESLRDALKHRAQLEDRSLASLMRLAARGYLEGVNSAESNPLARRALRASTRPGC